jgi:hypothetical protein
MNAFTATAFKALADDHRARLSVSWHLTDDRMLMSLRNSGAKGNGAIAMREVCALADRLNVKLRLMTSVDKLLPYYEGFGFRVTREHRLSPTYRAVTFARSPLAA